MTPTASINLMSLISRALIVLLFLNAGLAKITGFDGTVAYINANHVAFPQLAAAIGAVVEVGLGLLVLFGYQARWAALTMFVYVIVLPFIFHPYWSVPAAQVLAQKLNFYKDLSIAGALLGLAVWGPGGWSVDGMRARASGAEPVPAV